MLLHDMSQWEFLQASIRSRPCFSCRGEQISPGCNYWWISPSPNTTKATGATFFYGFIFLKIWWSIGVCLLIYIRLYYPALNLLCSHHKPWDAYLWNLWQPQINFGINHAKWFLQVAMDLNPLKSYISILLTHMKTFQEITHKKMLFPNSPSAELIFTVCKKSKRWPSYI